MKYIKKGLTGFFILNMLFFSVFAEKVPEQHIKSKHGLKSIVAGCIPASGQKELSINNVRARINTGGDMWWDLAGKPIYEIPRGSKKHSMFSASLWIGGVDVNGQLKLAALRYRQVGNDYWPGPLTTDGTASVEPETCIEWDKHFVIKKQDVKDFLGWRENPELYPDYTVPKSIKDYPAHGDVSKKQARYLAPFFDADGDGEYNWENGDYPYYDFDNKLCPLFLPLGTPHEITMEGNGILVDQVLKGDETLWWVFNDKGNVHTETSGAPIGMEIRAQAFAFATNDEINNMTFYSYEIINRSTYRLTETYFSQWVDSDVGDHLDDYVGCDVGRGLGYSYNGKDIDGTGSFNHYGAQPPAIGVDFFQGPYMDPDGIDNPKGLCDVGINGVNFGDTIVDNERFGMRRFVYHNNTGGTPDYMTDPDIAPEYYDFLRGIWKDKTKMLYGGNAHISSGAYGPACDFMFPDETDPCNWGTGGLLPNGLKKWTEETAGNEPYDRRFMQSAGPFILQPGAVNYITVGIPWARATSGGPFASVELLRLVDDKCQALFDNCFRVVDGPDAPDLVIRELDKELILYLTNKPNTNNYKETYEEYDFNIVSPDSLSASERYDSLYRFEGYQIFQLRYSTVTANEVHNADLARLVAQCDVKNGVNRLINFYFDESLNANVPVLEVNGADEGVVHSFRIIEDAFATGDKRLVNNKKYYFLSLGYGYNEFMKYTADPAIQTPDASLFGQKRPYLAGRKNIKSYTAIPHISTPYFGGTILNAQYGDGPQITRIEGHGNGGNILELTKESITEIVENWKMFEPDYINGKVPIEVKVIDPLNVKPGKFVLKFDVTDNKIDTARWILEEIDDNSNVIASHRSDKNISAVNEQLFLDLGISVNISQPLKPGNLNHETNGLLTSSITYADSSKRWLSGVPDIDGPGPSNWIRSGTTDDTENDCNDDYCTKWADGDPSKCEIWVDPEAYYEKIIMGTWAPYRLANRYEECDNQNLHPLANSASQHLNKLSNLYSVDIVFTPDKSKWSRCPVIETGTDKVLSQGNREFWELRAHPSIDKNGNTGTTEATYDGKTHSMGWFPGYAINVETGERLNIMYGESSWLAGDKGKDLIFNPTSNYESLNEVIFGGKHYLYIFGSTFEMVPVAQFSPAYDEGAWAYSKLIDSITPTLSLQFIIRSLMWVSIPMAFPNEEWLSNEATVRIRVSRPYTRNSFMTGVSSPQNNNWPMYGFDTYDIAPTKNDLATAKSALDIINIVPNPYYSYSDYEETQLDNLVKITNLPEKCTISIFTVSGTLVRRFTKDDPVTIIEWDLKNHTGVPISGGMYLIHVEAPGIGERTIKWFGSLRPLDLHAF